MGADGTVSGARDTLSPGELLLKDFSAGGEKDLLLEKDDAEEAGHLREAPGAGASGLWDWGVGGFRRMCGKRSIACRYYFSMSLFIGFQLQEPAHPLPGSRILVMQPKTDSFSVFVGNPKG